MTAPALLAVSHGTSSPEGQAAVSALVDAVRAEAAERAGRGEPAPGRIFAGFVDVQRPDLPELIAAVKPTERAVVVPLLLSAGYHVHVDIAREVGPLGGRIGLARALGPDDRLLAVVARRLAEAGLHGDDELVFAAAGSSDRRAVVDCREAATRLAELLDRPVRLAFLSAAEPSLPDAVATARESGRRVVVASYLLATGYFHDLARSAGADVVTEPLLTPDDTPTELVDVVLDRFAAAR